MPKVGKETITVRDAEDRDIYIQVEITINVNADGCFTTLLSESDVNTIESFNIEMYTDGRRNSRKGYFSNITKHGLVEEVREVLKQCMAKKLIEEKIIIRYSFQTVASFGFTVENEGKREIIPNMGWHEDGPPDMNLHWQKGTEDTHACNRHAVGVQMYVKPFQVRTYEFLNGKTTIEYYEMGPFGGSLVKDKDSQYYLHWLEQICSTEPPKGGKIKEIDYTEDRAKFFVEMFKAICKLAHNIANFQEPETLLKLIETGKYLM